MSDNPKIQFYKVNTYADSGKDNVSNFIKEWNGRKLKYIDYTVLDKMLRM
jgi:hypothetical protein